MFKCSIKTSLQDSFIKLHNYCVNFKVLVQSSSRSCLLFSLIGLELSHRTGGVNRELRVAAAASVPVLWLIIQTTSRCELAVSQFHDATTEPAAATPRHETKTPYAIEICVMTRYKTCCGKCIVSANKTWTYFRLLTRCFRF